MLTFTELITAESIYPCLDTFDVVLSRSRNVVSDRDRSRIVIGHVDEASNETRQYLRVYWATKEVVQQIEASAAQHRARDRLYPNMNHRKHHSHFHHHHHKHANYDRKYQHHHHHHHHHHNHYHRSSDFAFRPSMLIELRQLNYVREYSPPLKSQLVRVRCDVFEPDETIYYCFIYVVLHRAAIRFESLPTCVPTIADRDILGGGVGDADVINNNKINHHSQFDMGNYRNQFKYLNDDHGQMNQANSGGTLHRVTYNSDHIMNQHKGETVELTAANDTVQDSRQNLSTPNSMSIVPPGAAYVAISEKRNLLIDKEDDDDDDIDEPKIEKSRKTNYHSASVDSHNWRTIPLTNEPEKKESDEKAIKKDSNIRQFALKSSDQSDYGEKLFKYNANSLGYYDQQKQQPQQKHPERNRPRPQLRKRKKKVLIQTRSCYCSATDVDDSQNASEKAKNKKLYSSTMTPQREQNYNFLRLNLTSSDTIVLHLIITSCPAASTTSLEFEEYLLHPNDGSNSKWSDKTISTTTIESNKGFDELMLNDENDSNNKKDENVNASMGKSKGAIFGTKKVGRNGKGKNYHNRKVKGSAKNRTKESDVVASTDSISTISTVSSTTTTSTSTTTKATISNMITEDTEFEDDENDDGHGDDIESSSSDATVCILSIDNPSEYNFRLDNIEPSMEWHLHQQPNQLLSAYDTAESSSDTFDLIDYLGRFPYLIVRNGAHEIDPRVNIENRSQTHYFRSEHIRFEALSSINVTLRFRRSSRRKNDQEPNDRNLHFEHLQQQQHQRTQRIVGSAAKEAEEEDEEQHISPQHFSSAAFIATIKSLLDASVSYVASKVIEYGNNKYEIRSNSPSLLESLTPFHITSILLTLFIAITMIVFVAIGVMGARARKRSIGNERQESNIRAALMVPSVEFADFDLTPTSDDDKNDGKIHQRTRQDQAPKSEESLCLEQQSLEIDYYDYAVPLMHTSVAVIENPMCVATVEGEENKEVRGDEEEARISREVRSDEGGSGTNTTFSRLHREKSASCAADAITAIGHVATIRRSLEVRHHQPPSPAQFCTLPIKVRSPNRQIDHVTQSPLNSTANTTTTTTTTASTFTATAVLSDNVKNDLSKSTLLSSTSNVAIQVPKQNYQQIMHNLINDCSRSGSARSSIHNVGGACVVNANNSPNIATLTRLSFTKPPVLLSTFGRTNNNNNNNNNNNSDKDQG